MSKQTGNALSMSKGFTPILILIILLILGGVGFLIFKSTEMNSSPTKTPAGSLVKERNSVTKESWKNYSNQKYRYTIQYPDSWHLSTSNEQLVGISSFDLSLPNTPPNNTILNSPCLNGTNRGWGMKREWTKPNRW